MLRAAENPKLNKEERIEGGNVRQLEDLLQHGDAEFSSYSDIQYLEKKEQELDLEGDRRMQGNGEQPVVWHAQTKRLTLHAISSAIIHLQAVSFRHMPIFDAHR